MGFCKPVRNILVSEIERDAKRAVVDAVEGRWKRAEAFRRRAALRKFLNNAFAVSLLVAMAVGAAVWYLNRERANAVVDKMRTAVFSNREPTETSPSRTVPAPLLDGAREKTAVEKVVETIVTKPDSTAGFRERYVKLVEMFSGKLAGSWKSVPASMRPANVPAGTVYHALVPRRPAGCDIFELTTGKKGMTYDLLSPIAAPARVTVSDFKDACDMAGYLIAKDGQVYWCGKATAESAKVLQSRLQAKGVGEAR